MISKQSLTNVFISGGNCIEDIDTHLKSHLTTIPNNSTPSPDTIIRGIKELSVKNTVLTSASGKTYNFNINTKLNRLNLKSLILTKELEKNKLYDYDYDNQVLANKKYDSKKHTKRIQAMSLELRLLMIRLFIWKTEMVMQMLSLNKRQHLRDHMNYY